MEDAFEQAKTDTADTFARALATTIACRLATRRYGAPARLAQLRSLPWMSTRGRLANTAPQPDCSHDGRRQTGGQRLTLRALKALGERL
jgi:hypothetical protein